MHAIVYNCVSRNAMEKYTFYSYIPPEMHAWSDHSFTRHHSMYSPMWFLFFFHFHSFRCKMLKHHRVNNVVPSKGFFYSILYIKKHTHTHTCTENLFHCFWLLIEWCTCRNFSIFPHFISFLLFFCLRPLSFGVCFFLPCSATIYALDGASDEQKQNYWKRIQWICNHIFVACVCFSHICPAWMCAWTDACFFKSFTK